ncbi:MAG: hypothetical protein IIX14_01580 [Clostridia bacterium]|nr:hypothetical protein [Clostridia bacterium]
MKYRVSLLPERNRKRIIGKKKAEKGRGVANVVMLVLLAALLVTIVGKVAADAKLSEIQAKNSEYEQKVSALQQYRDINNNLQSKLKLINDIQVNEPQLYNFVARIGNVNRPGISVTKMDCVEWKTTRLCTLTGTATSRTAFTEYMSELENMQGVKSAVCTSYTVSVTDGEPVATFVVAITCEGGAAPIVEETTAATSTTAASDELAVE